MKFIAAAALLAALALAAASADRPARPRLLGISEIVVRSHDLSASRHFYGGLLGFEEAFTILKDNTAVAQGGIEPDRVSAVFYKVNNRQYIVVEPETAPSQSRFVRYAVETDDAERMRRFLASLGYAAPAKITTTPTHDLAFDITDPDGIAITIMQYTPESLSVRNAGKSLSADRLSSRILHAGFSVTRPETTKFYMEALALREFWRADPTMHAPGAKPAARPESAGPLLASLSNLKLPESDDYIEWSFSRKPVPPGTGGHIALAAPVDMQHTLAAIEARPAFRDYARRHEAHIGVNHKWQGNFFDPDGTRTEFMEYDTADGLPSPMSYAPWF